MIFPESKIFLNKHGVEFCQRDLEETAARIFKVFGSRAEQRGLELAYILLWALEKCSDKTIFLLMVSKVFARASRWPDRNLIKLRVKDMFEQEIVDELESTLEDRVLRKLDFEKLIKERPKEFYKTHSSNRMERHRAIQELKKHWEAKNGS